MIIDSFSNASKYYSLNPNFKNVFDFIAQNNIANLPDGMMHLSDGLRVIVSSLQGITVEESLKTFECHNRHIDIQITLKGKETFAWKPREKCVLPNGDFNDEKDIRFWFDKPDTFFDIYPNQFVILYPEDTHASMIGEGDIKKLIFKILI